MPNNKTNHIKSKKELREQYFLHLKELQKKYDKLLSIEETKHHFVTSKNKDQKKMNSIHYQNFIRELNILKNAYNNEHKKLKQELQIAKKNKDYQSIINFKLKLKINKRQFKLDKQALRHKYYLQTVDSIHANYIREREQLTRTYQNN
jgi:hypothetical protein